jgi:hypothetical protein
MTEKVKSLGNNVEVMMGIDPDKDTKLLQDIAYTYMIVFGNTPDLNEGGMHPEKPTISLDAYLSYLMSTESVKNERATNLLLQHPEKGPYTTKALRKILTWVDQLSTDARKRVLSEAKTASGGYSPYYNFFDVVTRFSQDLSPSKKTHPIVCYWGDQEHSLAGFLTGIVVDDFESFSKLFMNAPYLAQHHIDLPRQVYEFLSQAPTVRFPFVFEHEGVVIPERRSVPSGSRWHGLLMELRLRAQEYGASHLVGFTFENGKYYQNAKKNNALLHDFTTVSHTGYPMHFFITDIQQSIDALRAKKTLNA